MVNSIDVHSLYRPLLAEKSAMLIRRVQRHVQYDRRCGEADNDNVVFITSSPARLMT